MSASSPENEPKGSRKVPPEDAKRFRELYDACLQGIASELPNMLRMKPGVTADEVQSVQGMATMTLANLAADLAFAALDVEKFYEVTPTDLVHR